MVATFVDDGTYIGPVTSEGDGNHVHSYSASVTGPTCTEQGYTTYTCTCGDSYVGDYVSALGHDYAGVYTAPTGTEQGYTTYTCSRCGDSYVEIDNSSDFEYIVSDGKVTITGYVGSGGDVTIPMEIEGLPVKSIADHAFWGCTTLTGVTINGNLETINEYAFFGCESLTTVTFPDSVWYIGGWAFSGCTSLTNLTLPDSSGLFGGYAFSGCTSLQSVYIPASWTELEAVFIGCTSLEEITVDADNPTYKSIDGVVYDKDVKILVCCPGAKTEIDIPDTVESIELYAFYGCKSLTSVTLPDSVTFIDKDAFRGCSSLTDVTLPDGITSIGEDCFMGCTSLTSVKLPASLTCIDEMLFCGCTSLETVTIPDSVTAIEGFAFDECDSLANVYFNGSSEQWNAITKGSYNEPLDSSTIHTLVHNTGVAPGCVDTGIIEHWSCSACSDLLSAADHHSPKLTDDDLIAPALGHDYVSGEVVEPTCTEQGYTVYTCSRCGDNYDGDYVPASGHNYVAGEVVEPTCTEQGYTVYTCPGCGDSYFGDFVPAAGHNYVAGDVIEPTCTEQGYTVYTCSGCGDSYFGDYVPANGHSFSGGVCTVCGEVDPNCAAVIIEDVRAKAGDEITVGVYLENSLPVRSIAISDITLDSPVLALLGVEWDIEDLVISSWDENTGMGVAALTEARDINGKIVTLTIKVSDDAEDGDYSLTLTVMAKDEDGEDVSFVTEPGTVTVWSVLRGDFNGDERINDADAVYLLFHTFFPETYPLNQDGDVNGDGTVNDADAVYLLYYTFFPETYPLN